MDLGEDLFEVISFGVILADEGLWVLGVGHVEWYTNCEFLNGERGIDQERCSVVGDKEWYAWENGNMEHGNKGRKKYLYAGFGHNV